MSWFLLALLLFAPSLNAQRPTRKAAPVKADASSAWPIEAITIEGNKDYTRDQILAVAGLRTGQNASKTDFDAARGRLQATGAFEEIGLKFGPAPGGKGYTVSIQVREAGPLYPVRFEDLEAPEASLRQALQSADPLFGPKIPPTQALVDRYAKVLETHLAGKQKVVGRLLPDDAGKLTVTFRPVVTLPAISRVKFTGNAVVPSFQLENTINQVAIGVPYKEQRMRQLLEANILPLYYAKGRVRVAFPEIRTENDREVSGVIVTVKVSEGGVYALGEIGFTGTRYASAELLKVMNLKKGSQYDANMIQEGVARVARRLRRDGLLRVKTDYKWVANEKPPSVDVTVRIEEGPKYVFGKLTIQGLDVISEPAVRNMWGIEAGKPFNADYPDYFLNRVREDGVLDNLGATKSIVKADDETRTVDVTLVFKGEATPDSPQMGRKDRP